MNLDKIFSKIGKDKILIGILVGIIILVISIPVKSQGNSESTSLASSSTDTTMTVKQYQEYLEKKIQDVLSKVDGVGETTVMLSLKSTSRELLTTDSIPEVEGVVVVAKGGGNGTIQSEITAAMESMLGLSANKIKVLKSQ